MFLVVLLVTLIICYVKQKKEPIYDQPGHCNPVYYRNPRAKENDINRRSQWWLSLILAIVADYKYYIFLLSM